VKRLAVVTGASSGIGKATAALLRRKGYRVVGVSRRLSDTSSTRRCDIRDELSVRRCFEGIESSLGPIDILVNSAGAAGAKNALDLTYTDWQDMLDVNLIGSYFCCKYALKGMIRRRYGKIVNISSQAGRSFSRTSSLAYTCSKYGVIGLTRQLAVEFAGKNISINCICPSQVDTEMLREVVPSAARKALAEQNPMKRLARPEEIAETIAFLVSDAVGYMNGAILDVHGAKL
jgi:NAD(P)-dependent dehydrogenase (short-subunit alcohol dehydrogenase family)